MSEKTNAADGNDQMQQIASRIREMQDVLAITAAEMAHRVDISPEEYGEYKKGRAEPPVSVLYNERNAPRRKWWK